jgi:hypothetical protein
VPTGLTLSWALRRRRKAIPLILLAPLLPPRPMPRRPIFVLGCPRSGTSLVFRLLRMAPDTSSIGTEGHVLWETFHHPRRRNWESNAVPPEDIGSVERRYISWATRLLAGRGRFIDKTPRNVLRVPYLDALFPDASFVLVHRDGRAVVSSLRRNWEHRTRIGQAPPYLLPPGFAVEGMPERWWHFILVPGWQRLNGRPLEEVCAHQYVRSLEAMLGARDRLTSERIVELRFEDLLRDPVATMEEVYGRLNLAFDGSVAGRVRREVRPAPSLEAWRSEPAGEIDRILPMIRGMLVRTGYEV